MGLDDAIVNAFHILSTWEHNAEDSKKRKETRVNHIVTSARGQHGSCEQEVTDVDDIQCPSAFINVLLFNEELQQSDWLLGAITVNIGHVHVVYESDQLLAGNLGAINTSTAPVDVVFDGELEVMGSGSRGEVYVQFHVLFIGEGG
jgi:hypothetical protein